MLQASILVQILENQMNEVDKTLMAQPGLRVHQECCTSTGNTATKTLWTRSIMPGSVACTLTGIHCRDLSGMRTR